MSDDFAMGIVSTGRFLPDTYMTAAEIDHASGLPEWVVRDKLGIERKHVTDPAIHPNEMAVLAANEAIAKAGIDPMEIDVVLCTTEEWKEYNLWTAGIDLAWEVGARNSWGMDMHIRCATTVAALKLATNSIMPCATVWPNMVPAAKPGSTWMGLSSPLSRANVSKSFWEKAIACSVLAPTAGVISE